MKWEEMGCDESGGQGDIREGKKKKTKGRRGKTKVKGRGKGGI